jgi:serine kinase of HPr protein (carbohydrate metabolism regulator)
VLLRGPSGAGKSDLALRLIDRGAVLIADDRVVLRAEAGRLLAGPPATIAGLIEVRGVGIVGMPWRDAVPLALVVDLVAPGTPVARMPDPATVEIAGMVVASVVLDPSPPSAALKVELALAALTRASGDESA